MRATLPGLSGHARLGWLNASRLPVSFRTLGQRLKIVIRLRANPTPAGYWRTSANLSDACLARPLIRPCGVVPPSPPFWLQNSPADGLGDVQPCGLGWGGAIPDLLPTVGGAVGLCVVVEIASMQNCIESQVEI